MPLNSHLVLYNAPSQKRQSVDIHAFNTCTIHASNPYQSISNNHISPTSFESINHHKNQYRIQGILKCQFWNPSPRCDQVYRYIWNWFLRTNFGHFSGTGSYWSREFILLIIVYLWPGSAFIYTAFKQHYYQFMRSWMQKPDIYLQTIQNLVLHREI
jgi:hypothetical protein